MNAAAAALVQLTDTHLPAGGALLHGKTDTWARTSAVLEAAARFAPDAVLVTGDVSERGAPVHERAARLFERAKRELGCPVITVPGNHDPAGAVGAAFNRRRLASGPNPADTVNVVAGLRVIGLDTHGFREAGGRLEARQLAWLRAVLATPAARGSVLAMHHPPIDSLLPELAGRGLARTGDLSAALAGSDVRGILCGHYHLPCSGNLGGIPVWVSPAVSYNHDLFAAEAPPGTDPSWFSVIKVGAGQLSATPVRVPVPAAVASRKAPVPARLPALLEGAASLSPMTYHQITLGAINLEAADPTALARFWATVTGAEPSAGGDSVYLPPNGPGGFGMFFQPATGPRAERQVAHWDLTVPWGSRAAEVDRLIGLGATHKWDCLDEVPHVQWTTLADPEGNLFCVAEHPPADQQRP